MLQITRKCTFQALLSVAVTQWVLTSASTFPDKIIENREALRACIRQSDPEYHGQVCTAYFDRDTSSRYYCEDQSCLISEAVNNKRGNGAGPEGPCSDLSSASIDHTAADFYAKPPFVYSGADNRTAQPIPCGRVLFNGYDTPCVKGENWANTALDTNVRNYMYADFETPQYQTNSCCSSRARFGFTKAGSAPQFADVNNPFALSEVKVTCDLQRRSFRGDTCGQRSRNGPDNWNLYGGHGSCGLRGIPDDEAIGEDTFGVQFARSAYCEPDSLKASCEKYNELVQRDDINVDCDQSIGSFTLSTLQRNCPLYDFTVPVQNITSLFSYPLSPFDREQKETCQGCHALVNAMNGFACSGNQGSFAKEGKFKICQSSCNRLFDTCGLPAHRGGMYITSFGNKAEGRIDGDYTNATEMCHAMWNPNAEGFWAINGYVLEVIDDTEENHVDCASFERGVYTLHDDVQNFIFAYDEIRNGEGFCSTMDPLYNNTAPCADLQEAVDIDQGRKRRDTSEDGSNSTPSMYALDDAARNEQIANGWPYENPLEIWHIALISLSAVVALTTFILLGVYYVKNRRGEIRCNGEICLDGPDSEAPEQCVKIACNDEAVSVDCDTRAGGE